VQVKRLREPDQVMALLVQAVQAAMTGNNSAAAA
jgi:hypothetical protein